MKLEELERRWREQEEAQDEADEYEEDDDGAADDLLLRECVVLLQRCAKLFDRLRGRDLQRITSRATYKVLETLADEVAEVVQWWALTDEEGGSDAE